MVSLFFKQVLKIPRAIPKSYLKATFQLPVMVPLR